MSDHDRHKTVVITGASDGIGAAAARKLQSDGHCVVIIGRSPDKTRRVAVELGADYHVADFSRLDEVRQLAVSVGADFRRIDVLVNNAGGKVGEHPVHQGTARSISQRRTVGRGVPRRVDREQLGSDATSRLARVLYGSRLARRVLSSPDKGARHLIWLAEGTPGTDWQSGEYYEKGKPAKKVNPQARNAELARQLWDRSADLVGLR